MVSGILGAAWWGPQPARGTRAGPGCTARAARTEVGGVPEQSQLHTPKAHAQPTPAQHPGRRQPVDQSPAGPSQGDSPLAAPHRPCTFPFPRSSARRRETSSSIP